MTFVSGPGKFDANTKTVTYTLKDLKAKESRTNDLVVKVVAENDLPIQNGEVCAVNQSFVSADSMSDQDNATFCIEKKKVVTKGGLPVKPAPPIKEAPPTGPEMAALFALIPVGLSGLLLRRKTNLKK